MFEVGKDFVVENKYGVIRCLPKSVEAASAFKVLQLQLVRLAPQLPEPLPVAITVDGMIGPGSALATQMVIQRLCEGAHQEMAAIAIAQPEEAIPAIAASAMEIAGYFDHVMTTESTALVAPQPPPEPEIDLVQMAKQLFTGKRIAAIGGLVAGFGGLALAAGASDRRALGYIDRSSMLPPSDGTDEFDDDEYEDETEAEDEEDNETEHEPIEPAA